MSSESVRVRGLGLAYAVSGACGLLYQVVWYHALVEELGAAGTTYLVVLCAFIGGLGLGSLASERFYRIFEARFGGHGLANYGRTELLVTLAAFALFFLTRPPPPGLLARSAGGRRRPERRPRANRAFQPCSAGSSAAGSRPSSSSS